MANDIVSGVKSGLSGKGIGAALALFGIMVAFAFFGVTPEGTASKLRSKIG